MREEPGTKRTNKGNLIIKGEEIREILRKRKEIGRETRGKRGKRAIKKRIIK